MELWFPIVPCLIVDERVHRSKEGADDLLAPPDRQSSETVAYILPGYAFKAVNKYAGFMGSLRIGFPVASWKVAAIAGAASAFAASEPPPSFPTLGFDISSTLSSGISAIVRIG